MALYYGIGGRRIGSVGNETYTLVKSNNVVKAKVIHVNDAKTPEQIEQRSKLENTVKAYKQIGSEFLRKCFEFKKRQQSTYNAFVSANTRFSKAFFKKYSKDPDILGVGIFKIADGSLPRIPVGVSEDIVIDEVTYSFYGIKVGGAISKDSTVAEVSTELINTYHLQEGMYLNGLGVYNEGVRFNPASVDKPLTLAEFYMVVRDKQNFQLNKTDDTPINQKGFTIVGADNNKFLVLLGEFDRTALSRACIYSTSANDLALGYCAFFVSQKVNGQIKVSTAVAKENSQLEALIQKIDENPMMVNGWLATAMKILIITSYGIKKIIEIIRDWPI